MADSEVTKEAKPEAKLPHDPVKDLIDHGREVGYLTYDEINRRLPENLVTGEELDELFGKLEDLGIEVVDREADLVKPTDKPAEEEVVPDISTETTNSIRMYLTEMGKVPLLTREQELTLAKFLQTLLRRTQRLAIPLQPQDPQVRVSGQKRFAVPA